jgi:hypothetical protein
VPVRSTAIEPSRTSSARPLRAGPLASLAAGLLLAVAGCHGGAQTDVVEREMRWQEDQIYAMEDYLGEYQQLLCQYRAENSALKRQLSQGNFKQRPDSRVRRDEEKIQDTQEIIRELDQPLAPPLMETMPGGSSDVEPREYGPNLEFRPARRQTPNVRRTALEQKRKSPQLEPNVLPLEPQDDVPSVDLEQAFTADETTSDAKEEDFLSEASARPIETLQFVMVRGDVLPQESQGGPRLLVDVEPLGASGGPAAFEGELSLMILDVSGESPRGVARWDFKPEQLTELLGDAAGLTMQFPLQLPAGTPTNGQLEIWARLVPTGGEKVLASAELNLQEAGPFSSEQPQFAAAEEPAEELADDRHVEPVVEPIVVAESDSMSVGAWNGWEVAQPGQHVERASAQQPPTSQWRKATQPLPTKVNHGRPVVATAEPPQSGTAERVARHDNAAPIDPPSWSPDRSGNAVRPADSVAAPSWSPER